MKRNDWTKDEIKSLLETRDDFVERALLKLYNYQTDVEKINKETKVNNNVGFNGADAKILSDFCEWLKGGQNRHLTKNQMYIARLKIKKYSGQITNIANNQLDEVS
jgi:SHS2 domain-containing protein